MKTLGFSPLRKGGKTISQQMLMEPVVLMEPLLADMAEEVASRYAEDVEAILFGDPDLANAPLGILASPTRDRDRMAITSSAAPTPSLEKLAELSESFRTLGHTAYLSAESFRTLGPTFATIYDCVNVYETKVGMPAGTVMLVERDAEGLKFEVTMHEHPEAIRTLSAPFPTWTSFQRPGGYFCVIDPVYSAESHRKAPKNGGAWGMPALKLATLDRIAQRKMLRAMGRRWKRRHKALGTFKQARTDNS